MNCPEEERSGDRNEAGPLWNGPGRFARGKVLANILVANSFGDGFV